MLKLTSGVNSLNIVMRSALSDYEVKGYFANLQVVFGTNELALAINLYKLRGVQKKVALSILYV